jgi:stringent starvation protein B
MKARRPYLLRAIHEWITDSMCTPHIVVDAGVTGVEVPRQFVQDGKIVLNVSWTATANLRLTNDDVSFSGRFRRRQHVGLRADHGRARDLRARDGAGHDLQR